jgi:aminopeptidase N
MNSPVETSSASFSSSEDYGITVYIKAALWMYIMEISIGKENLEKAMHAYFEKWKFRHPYPEDLKEVIENSSGTDMNKLFMLLDKKGSFK